MSKHVPLRSYAKMLGFFAEGFTICELAIMYTTSEYEVTKILETTEL